ncbi:hypothetical protein LTR99_001535 [Exophiala xenobiotica]|uniref:Uncharacterized protein n=1 Tax=Vermiconidia calcicola TaxID=1690605 RepID=A0AAV9QKU5_9PEZI|nr:hypothetical protein LTR92_008870 [Exophiala xenobiotica]KAK5544044.1 hypothetical protein LTR25_001659 [Vermiconidia calcicola]KAK5547676.1 hypothetical protein LTR23_002429 [Chaetothyriales sp. CCFEE 6169]KAK5308559.1 hypothetical protein LTR99_001535 [Exophiala xenobiotica]KAK5438061.1 hypothetical protein LTR34_001609 [Exophiala xenobiotica]
MNTDVEAGRQGLPGHSNLDRKNISLQAILQGSPSPEQPARPPTGACPSYSVDGINETAVSCRPVSTLSTEPIHSPINKHRLRNPLAGLDRQAVYALQALLTPLIALIIFWIITEALRRCLRP